MHQSALLLKPSIREISRARHHSSAIDPASHRDRTAYSADTLCANTMIKRLLKITIGIELVYLLVVNGLLQLQLTQDLVNKIRPEKFYVTWEQAWSWYPFRFHAEGIFANGQARMIWFSFDTY